MDAHFASALRDDAVGEKRRFVSLRAAKGGDLCPAGVSNLLVGKEWMDCFGADAPRNDTSRFPVFHLTHNLLVLPRAKKPAEGPKAASGRLIPLQRGW